jgi:hypothetical protein
VVLEPIACSEEIKCIEGRPKLNELIVSSSINSLIHQLKEEDSEL